MLNNGLLKKLLFGQSLGGVVQQTWDVQGQCSMMFFCQTVIIEVCLDIVQMLKQACLERQDWPSTYLAHVLVIITTHQIPNCIQSVIEAGPVYRLHVC